MRIARSIEIDRPPEAIWPHLTEVERIRRWMPDLVSDVPTSAGPVGPGTTSLMTMREGSRVIELRSVIRAFEPARRLALELSGASLGAHPMAIEYALTPAGERTRLDFRETWRPSGLLWLMVPLIRLVGGRAVGRTLAALKAACEA